MSEPLYWFYLEPYVFVDVKYSDTLLYNSLSGKIIHFQNNPTGARLFKRIVRRSSLYVIELTAQDIAQHPDLHPIISRVKKYFMGDLIKASPGLLKPLQIMPLFRIQRDADNLRMKPIDLISSVLINNLLELTIQVCNDCKLNCKHCSSGFRQFTSCWKASKRPCEMSPFDVSRIIAELSTNSRVTLNILGGDLMSCSHLATLFRILNRAEQMKSYYLHIDALLKHSERLANVDIDTSNIIIIADSPPDLSIIEKCSSLIERSHLAYRYTAFVETQKELCAWLRIIERGLPSEVRIQPYFNKRNLSFFSKHVFIRKRHLISEHLSMKDIYARTIINQNCYGKTTIDAKGNVFSNMNFPHIANIRRSGIVNSIFKEIINGRRWLQPRSLCSPCNDCVFNALCPSISNYEHALHRHNLCHIWEGRATGGNKNTNDALKDVSMNTNE